MTKLEEFKWNVLRDFESHGLEGKTSSMLFTLQLTIKSGDKGYDDVLTPELERMGLVCNKKATEKGNEFFQYLEEIGYYKNGNQSF